MKSKHMFQSASEGDHDPSGSGTDIHVTKEEFGDSIDVGPLLRSSLFYYGLKVLVVSDSSWMWVLGSAQLGIGDIV